ncbi:MAG TPA: carboxypeptidase-like regulatory domain-containing protein [Gemmatimonadaceae bacterium]|nr:carboxypeptidase-like regulatory domain-containing protein [Gemmatimonadaceae bacterium]
MTPVFPRRVRHVRRSPVLSAFIRIILAASIPILASPSSVVAQQGPAEIIRGRVTDDSARALVATVMVTRGPDRLTLQDTTDANGNYSIRFEQGTGDYLVYVTATGFKAARRRVQREGTETEFVANFSLTSDVAQLEAVRVSARRPVRASNNVTPTQLEPGSSESWNQGVSGQLPPTVAGDLNAVGSIMSNITMTPSGTSILGSGSESNLNTLNGMGLAAGAIPRAARTETRVTGATFDPTRGGFAGANVDVRLGPGSRNVQRRNGFITLDPRALQFTDPLGRSVGGTPSGFRASFGADGELIRRALTYNVAVDVARNASDPATLTTAEGETLLLAGVSPDSVARLIALASPLGVVTGSGLPTNREHQAMTWLGRLDDTRDTLQTRALTSYVGFTKDGALGFGPLSAPSAAGERRERTLGAQLTLGMFVGPGRRVLTETRIAASGVSTEVAPYRQQPGVTVLVRSASEDAQRDITSLTLGGGTFLPADDDRWTAEAANETVWNAIGRRHKFKALLWGRADGLRQEGRSNALGSFAFNSIEDFAAGRPASFSRTLSQPVRTGSVWNSALAFAHQFAPKPFFNMLYGARVEADGFMDSPASNPTLETALGVTTGAAPGHVHISPRLGFSYTYNRDRDNGSGTNQSPVGRFYRNTVGVIRGGIGEFRDLLRPGILADASGSTGLPGATSNLSCVGAAVPAADWALFESDPTQIPTQCRDGSGLLSERAPAVTLIDPSYDVPRSWRASLDWNTNIAKWLIRVSGLGSYDLSQPGTVDVNFAGVPRLTLAGESNRPVFVSSGAIDPASGSVSAAESRISNQFGRVGTRVSDLRGYGGQLTLGISPDVFKMRPRFSMFGSLGYTVQWSHRQFRGFDGAGFGDPRQKEWAPSATDARHVLVLTGGLSTQKTGTLTMFARAQSGLPFTPIVQGDVNGDGRGGDRAFIPNPASESDASLKTGMEALLETGAATAKNCLRSNLGQVASRNGCRGPWTQSLNIQWRPPMPSRWGGRVIPVVYLQNVLAGVDQALHGNGSLRGWGSQASPDPVLLVPRGFDAAANRFRYDVNPRFGDNRQARTIGRDPFRIVIDFTLNLSTNFDLQELRRAVEPVKSSKGWERRSADSIAAFYMSNTSSIHKLLINETDSLFLSKAQVAALRVTDSVFSARVRAIYGPLGEFLAKGAGNAGKAEMDTVKTVQKAYWKIFWEQPEIAAEIVTASQRTLIPMFERMLATPKKERENSQWQFGYPVKFSDAPTPPRAATPADGGTQIRR